MKAVFAVLLLLCSFGAPAAEGMIDKPGRFSVTETVAHLEAVLKESGWTVFARIDHAAVGEKEGVRLRPMVVVLFGNPKAGALAMYEKPAMGIDLPMKALVWVDDRARVWLSYNSADYVFNTLYARHGLKVPPDRVRAVEKLLDEITDRVIKTYTSPPPAGPR